MVKWLAALYFFVLYASSAFAETPRTLTISVIGTNDLHGRLEALPILAGYLDNLRAQRTKDGGAVLLLDAGDMFQGTLESNLNEGKSVIEAYNALGYHAATIGNHEFDYGSVGPTYETDSKECSDVQGALKARIQEAKFPIVSANLRSEKTNRLPRWKNLHASTLLTLAGVRVGVIGIATEETPRKTLARNFAGLRIEPIAKTVIAEARKLRKRGAKVIVALAHAGGECHDAQNPEDISSCDPNAEMFLALNQIPKGTVDVVVGGHTHKAVAHRVHGTAMIEAHSVGRAFGRVDVTVDPKGKVSPQTKIYAPQFLCESKGKVDSRCKPFEYEGAAVTANAQISQVVAPHLSQAKNFGARSLGVRMGAEFPQVYARESAAGNLLADAMRAAAPNTDVAIINGGGLRSKLPKGELHYLHWYEFFPFDDPTVQFAITGKELKSVFVKNLKSSAGILSISGLRVQAKCVAQGLHVDLVRSDGRFVADDERLTLVTTYFLVSGGDGVFSAVAELDKRAIFDPSGQSVRDKTANQLTQWGAVLEPRTFYTPKEPRFQYPGKRPVHCR